MSHQTREQETAAAMETLGCEWQQWGYADENPDWRAVRRSLQELKEMNSGAVFAPAPEESGNEQHNMLGRLAQEVFDNVTYYLTYTLSGKSRWGWEVEYEPGWLALKHRALACYESQCAHPETRLHFLDDLREYVA